jgi:glutaminase
MKKTPCLASIVTTIIVLCVQSQVLVAQVKKGKTGASSYQTAIENAYAKYKDLHEGKNADYIKELATVDPNIYGVAIVTVDGQSFTKGDLASRISIQSISSIFTLARVVEEQGTKAVMDKIGVNGANLRSNSITAVELQQGKDINPLVKPGAIAAASLINGTDSAAKWKNILDTHSDFAGSKLYLNQRVYIGEAADNSRNQAIAQLLSDNGRLYFDPVQATDLYTKQCALNINAKDLAIMASTLANGGTNPITKKKIVSPETCSFIMSVMATAGLHENSGEWLYAVGLPGKSGVGGGIIAICPGKFGIAVISPPLNAAGNSVKAEKTIHDIVKELKVNPYLVEPVPGVVPASANTKDK